MYSGSDLHIQNTHHCFHWVISHEWDRRKYLNWHNSIGALFVFAERSYFTRTSNNLERRIPTFLNSFFVHSCSSTTIYHCCVTLSQACSFTCTLLPAKIQRISVFPGFTCRCRFVRSLAKVLLITRPDRFTSKIHSKTNLVNKKRLATVRGQYIYKM